MHIEMKLEMWWVQSLMKVWVAIKFRAHNLFDGLFKWG